MLWSLAHACQVWSTSVSTFHSYPVYRMTDEIRRQNFNQKWSGIRIRIFGLIRIWMWCLSDLSRNVVDTVSCQCQSFRQVWCKWAVDCMRNANKINVQKSPIPQCWRKWKKMTRNPHADPDHLQKLITSRGSLLAHACQVWSTSVSVFVRELFCSQNDRQNDHITSALLSEVITLPGLTDWPLWFSLLDDISTSSCSSSSK